MNPLQQEDWALERCGHATASEFASILAKGQGKMRWQYLRRVLAERLTGKPCETYRNARMDEGLIQEPYARLAYEAHTGNVVELAGFIRHPTVKWCGCSPDGLIDHDGGAEIKSVLPTTQLETILSGGYPPEHKAQVQGNLWVTDRDWWDFVSYCPDMPERLRLYVFRVQRDEDYIQMLEREVRGLLQEVQTRYDVLMGNDLKVMAA
jgi:YqaJ-like recombinase protein